MKKFATGLGALLAVLSVSMLMMMCSAGGYKDGIYFAQGDDFEKGSGWKDLLTLEVKGGKIVQAEWEGVNSEVPVFKSTYVNDGKYIMKPDGDLWTAQAAKVAAFLVESQDPAKVTYSDPEGHTDAIAGVSIHVKAFFVLAEKALAAGPSVRGPYADGIYHAEAPDFDKNSGWKSMVDVLVKNGNIVNACWNALTQDGSDKFAALKAGKYVMKKDGVAWNVQARDVVRELIKTQDPAKIEYSDAEGHTDAIAGVSIHVKEFFELAQMALETAK